MPTPQVYDSTFSNFTNNVTKIKFYSGTQADLTKYIKGTYTNQDTPPEEGAFYLTTDTQRLYVGRKRSSDNKILAVQVSKGVTFVSSASDLPTPNASEVEEGELYYITSQNILAALTYDSANSIYQWQQINSSTGLRAIVTSMVKTPSTGTITDVAVNVRVDPVSGDSQTGKFHIIPGSNVSVSTGSTNSNTEGTITINATDTTYDLGTNTSSSSGIIKLTDNVSGSSPDLITLTGDANDSVKVTSDNAGNVSIHGSTFSNISVAGIAAGNGGGFNITLNGKDGAGADLTAGTASTGGSKLDPIISYGDLTGTQTQVHFISGTASLDVYTRAQANTAITNAINEALQVADAMTFKGVVTSGNATGDATSLLALVNTNGAHNGDVYKVAANDDEDTRITIDGVQAEVGDLIILCGTENSSGLLSYNSNSLTSLLTLCQLVPSGDEPEVTASLITNSSGLGANPAQFKLYDGNTAAQTNILTTKFASSENGDILIKGTDITTVDDDGKILKITAEHPSKNRVYNASDNTTGDRTDLSLVTHTDANPSTSADHDTLGNGKYELFVLNGPGGLNTDNYGHVLGLQGKTIIFQHNKIETITDTYSTQGAAKTAQVQLQFNDTLENSLSKISAKLHSETLSLTGDNTNKYINIELTWGTF